VKRIVKLLALTEDAMDADLYLQVFTDGGGFVTYFADDTELLQFKNEQDLIMQLKGLRNSKTSKHELN